MQLLPAQSPLARYHTGALQGSVMPPPSVGALKNETQGNSQEFLSKAPRFPPHSSSDLSLVPSSDPAPPALAAQGYAYPAPPSLGYDRSSQPSSVPRSSQFTAPTGTAPSLPALSQPTETVATLAPQPAPQSAPANQHDDESEKRAHGAFLQSLREVPELYNLPRRELENLVSTVVREPGFPELVRAFVRYFSRLWAGL